MCDISCGAGTVVTKDVPDNSVCVGNPCKVICSYDEYIAKEKNLMGEYLVINEYPQEILQNKDSMELLIRFKRGFIK